MITTPTRRPRTHARTFALALAAGALVVGTSACTGGTAEAEEAEDTTDTTPAPDPVATTADTGAGDDATAPAGGDLLDGTRQVDIQTYGGEWVTTTVEGSVTTVADPAEAGGVPTTWVFEPTGTTFQVRTTATTDGQPSCLSLPGDDVIAVAPCDPAAPDQQLDVAALDQPEQVNISSAAGVVVADQEGGLALDPDPSSPASVFTLVDRGAAEG